MTCNKRFYTLCLSFLIFFLITTASYGDTVTSLSDSGPGSLRDAIANTAPGGTVDFDVTGTITLLTELVIDKDLNIDGPGAGLLTVSGGGVTSIFVISGGTDITISGLRIADGNSTGFLGGSAILLVSANSNAEINDCVFENNTTTGNLGLGIITNLANGISLVVNRCSFTDNSSVVTGGGFAGGGVFGTGASDYSIEVNDSTFTRNSAQSQTGLVIGGVIGIGAGDLVYSFNNCTFDSNFARSNGSALVIGGVFGDGGVSNTVFTNCTFYNNRAECNGVNCLAIGGAIGFGGGSSVSCNFCTFDSNRTACTGAGCDAFGDAISNASSQAMVEISNSIINGEDPSNNCGSGSGPSVISLGYNIDNGNTCVDGSVTGDKPNTNPRLDPDGLQDNGGFTETIALLPSSPAVDMADPACPPPFTDERGVERPQQTACDIGAYELFVQVSNIPTMSEWGLIITAGLLGIAGLMVIRRRKAAA